VVGVGVVCSHGMSGGSVVAAFKEGYVRNTEPACGIWPSPSSSVIAARLCIDAASREKVAPPKCQRLSLCLGWW